MPMILTPTEQSVADRLWVVLNLVADRTPWISRADAVTSFFLGFETAAAVDDPSLGIRLWRKSFVDEQAEQDWLTVVDGAANLWRAACAT